MTRDPREEAERLVAAALAAVSVAARGTTGFATGSAECCVCPLCKAIAAMRDPDPTFAERLASGAGDLATGLAGVLRAFGGAPDGFAAGASATGASTAGASATGASTAPASETGVSAPVADGPGPAAPEDTGFGNIASSGASASTRKQAEPADDVWHAATAPPVGPTADRAEPKPDA